MHDILRERLWRNLEALPEERLYQVLDYIEFLNSKYARDRVRPASSGFRRFGEKLEDSLRLQGVGFSAIRGTLGVMETADRVVSELTEAGRSILREVGDTLQPPPAADAAPALPAAGPKPEDDLPAAGPADAERGQSPEGSEPSR